MIQLNLLPDIKIEYIKTKRSRRMALSISVVVSAVAVAILVLLLGATALQKKHSSDLSKDITKESSQLQHKPQATRVLTVQNQLNSLTGLHQAKPAADRVYTYLNEVTPTSVSITNFKIDYNGHNMDITGSSDALSSVNKYIDTLKFTGYNVKGEKGTSPAFSQIVLKSFKLNNVGDTNGHPANYEITLSYDTTIFDTTKEVTLNVPDQTSTRSTLPQQSSDLFQARPGSKTTGGN